MKFLEIVSESQFWVRGKDPGSDQVWKQVRDRASNWAWDRVWNQIGYRVVQHVNYLVFGWLDSEL